MLSITFPTASWNVWERYGNIQRLPDLKQQVDQPCVEQGWVVSVAPRVQSSCSYPAARDVRWRHGKRPVEAIRGTPTRSLRPELTPTSARPVHLWSTHQRELDRCLPLFAPLDVTT